MSQEPCVITVLGLDVAFRQGADMQRAKQLAQYVEDRYEAQKEKYPAAKGKDVLLTFLVLGMAEELLQMKTMQRQGQARLEKLLEQIEDFL